METETLRLAGITCGELLVTMLIDASLDQCWAYPDGLEAGMHSTTVQGKGDPQVCGKKLENILV